MVDKFEYYSPTKVIFGQGAENQLGEQIQAFGGSRVLLVYGGQSALKSGLIGRVRSLLDASGLPFVELPGVQPNPRISLIREGIALLRQEKLDFVLAVGGGSAMDTAKAVATGAMYAGDPWDFYAGLTKPEATLPVGCIVTLAASGSETSYSCVITNEETGVKNGCRSNLNRPSFAILNPDLTRGVPPYHVACGAVDIFMHTMERYFSPGQAPAITDTLAETLMRNTMLFGKRLYDDPNDDQARAELMYMSSISHNDLTGLGKRGDWAVHHIEHALGGIFDVAHGAGLAALWCAWANFVYQQDVARFAQFAVQVCGLPASADLDALARAGIAHMADFYRSVGMPTSLTELGLADISAADIARIADICTAGDQKKEGTMREMNKAEVEQLLRNAR